ncbi:tripartite tricarboxylate transporter substrate binding protein [Bosea sp. BK604]|uniref:Bug family tripartite tricarboxylate transporter substrate binding protein n=1 Tax=Bosea sp. BK604 TaxID=2512180 RepID=UPI001044515B|nr:tripartite tricarboxylate transporter substrate binding protein [Bosea sp. BK604]TCR70635.1 putative tricarboxylic transport membrane protein [Bosea sp. BK604]
MRTIRKAALMKAALLGAMALGLLVVAPAGAAEWKPSRNVELVVGAGAGGSIDAQARLIAQAIERHKLIDTTMTVVNKPGAGSSQAISYLGGHAGDGHYITLLASSWIGTAILMNKPNTFKEVTPLARLFDVPLGFIVKADSPLKTTKDLAEALKKDPGAYRFAISTTAGNNNHLAVLRFAQLVGVDPKKVRVIVNDSGATSLTQMLGGHLEICVCGIGDTQSLAKAGQIRYLGSLRDEPIPGFENIPTVKSQGYDVSIATFYTMVAPKGVSPEIVGYWTDVLAKAIATPEVKNAAEQLGMTIERVDAATTAAFITNEREVTSKRLGEFGFVQK